MTHKWLHIFTFIFVLSLSAHLAHEVTVHDDAVCEVCLYGKAMDDGLISIDDKPQLRVLNANQINELWIKSFVDVTNQDNDPIRGPPQFSFI